MDFFVVYTKNRKKFDKYVKNNRVKKKYVIDIKEILKEEELDFNNDKIFIKTIIFQKIERAIETARDIYYIPYFDDNDFSIEKLLNIKKILENNNFNILVFHDEFTNNKHDKKIIDDIMDNLNKFNSSQIIRDY